MDTENCKREKIESESERGKAERGERGAERGERKNKINDFKFRTKPQ